MFKIFSAGYVCHKMSQNVTKCHKMSQGVTRCHKISQNVTTCHQMSQNVSKCHKIWGNYRKLPVNYRKLPEIKKNVTKCHKVTMDHYHVSRYSSSFRPAARAAGTGACFLQNFANFVRILLNLCKILTTFFGIFPKSSTFLKTSPLRRLPAPRLRA